MLAVAPFAIAERLVAVVHAGMVSAVIAVEGLLAPWMFTALIRTL
jgi:hypothetical protein